MLIQHKQKENRGIFFIAEDEEVLAEMIYSLSTDGNMIIEHTEVSEELRGKNIGFELVNQAAEYARTHHIKITPVCTFAKAVFDKKPDLQDVLI